MSRGVAVLCGAWLLVIGCGGRVPATTRSPASLASPYADADLDRISDALDECPQEPEDRDGFDDGDGCADSDNDADGVRDVDDLCPNDWEDCDGFVDEDGCPDLDNDQDRIPDACDRCPNEPETYNAIVDEDGCPDRSICLIQSTDIMILEHVYFARNVAAVPDRLLPVLDAVAAVLSANPAIELVGIVGHADARETNPHRIAQARAAAVVAALRARGVDASRLAAYDAGAGAPLDPRDTSTTRERNRRVEFFVVRGDARVLFRWDGTRMVQEDTSAAPVPPASPSPPQPPLPGCEDGASPLPLRPPPGGCARARPPIDPTSTTP